MAGMSRLPDRDDVTLSEAQWAAVEPLIPKSAARTGRPMADRRRMFEGMLYQLVVGCQWRHVPRDRYGPWGTVYHHFNRWRREGVFERLADALRLRADEQGLIDWSVLCADGTNVRAAACSAGGRLSPSCPRSRRSRLTTPSDALAAGSAPSCTS